MKKIFSFILTLLMATTASMAQSSDIDSDPSTEDIILELDAENPNPGRHRAPMRIDIAAYYNAMSRTIEIIYAGEAEGEVFLYLNGGIIDYSNELNTTFQISGSGLYQIEVITSSWTAKGSVRI